jgi:hypothetical protein
VKRLRRGRARARPAAFGAAFEEAALEVVAARRAEALANATGSPSDCDGDRICQERAHAGAKTDACKALDIALDRLARFCSSKDEALWGVASNVQDSGVSLPTWSSGWRKTDRVRQELARARRSTVERPVAASHIFEEDF